MENASILDTSSSTEWIKKNKYIYTVGFYSNVEKIEVITLQEIEWSHKNYFEYGNGLKCVVFVTCTTNVI